MGAEDIYIILAVGFAIGILVLSAFKAAGTFVQRTLRGDLHNLREFSRDLGGNLRVRTRGALEGSLVAGTYEGRKVTIQLGACAAGIYTVQFGVQIDPTIDLRIQRPSLLGRVQRALTGEGVETGSEVDRYLVSSGDAESARDLFVHGGSDLTGVLEELMESGPIGEVTAHAGWLYLECELQALDSRWFRWYFNRMLKVARYYERSPIRVRQVERYAWTGGGTQGRCPFCHDALGERSHDLVACDTCQTLHHGECFDLHGGCTIYGCEGRRREVLSA